ncbi:MAG: galactokinase [Daejeonella sp.]
MSNSISDYQKAIETKFQELFNQQPLIIRSPGRINLIGEHTDYNKGFVLPAAINKAIYLGIQRRDDHEIHLHSFDYNEDHQTTTGQVVRSGKLWPDYVLGVVEQVIRIHKRNNMDNAEGNGTDPKGGMGGEPLGGFNIVFGGDIPPGAGLSSSAALECATAYALNEIFGLKMGKMDMVKISQAAENEFVGMKCGIMDQFASMFGKKDHLIRLDCQSLEYTYIPFRLEGVTVVLFDTRVKHSLASSAYNERREQCEEGVRLVRAQRPEVESLRDTTEEMLLNYVKPVNELVYHRCSFVVAEIERLLSGCRDLDNNDVKSFGKKMFETHDGLSKLYEVSCKELDILVDLVKADPNVLGSRMMGGGFGGCTINLIKNEAVSGLITKVSEMYKKETGVEMLVYEVDVEDGTGMII